MKKNDKRKSTLKKIKIYFSLFIIGLWYFAGCKLFLVVKDYHSSTNSFESDENFTPNEKKEIDSPATIFFTDYVNHLYGEYYDIFDVTAVAYFPEDEDYNENDKFYFVRIEKKLKYNSVFQMPFVAGMKRAVEDFKNSKTALDIYNKKTNELKTYIGKKQIEYNLFKVSFLETNNFRASKIEIATYYERMPADRLKPQEPSVIFNYGYNFIKTSITMLHKKIEYDNFTAISYADKYSSNPVQTGINTKKWNDKYKQYENDCANFVSQCIYAGGINPTKYWFPGSYYWIRTGSPKYPNISGVSNYMKKRGAFLETNYSAVSAGGFICLVQESHVVFITSNDSITILFNGHTNDRKRISFPHLCQREAIYLSPNN